MQLKVSAESANKDLLALVNEGYGVLQSVRDDYGAKRRTGTFDESRDITTYTAALDTWATKVMVALRAIFPTEREPNTFRHPDMPLGVTAGNYKFENVARKLLAMVRGLDKIRLGLPGIAGPGESGSGGPAMHFHGPVGAVQTGAQSSAVVHQEVTAVDLSRIAEALEALRGQLQSVDAVGGNPAKEVIAIVDESIGEARKREPNRLKLVSGANAAAVAIQTVAALRPAYDAIKLALIPFGVTLP